MLSDLLPFKMGAIFAFCERIDLKRDILSFVLFL